MITKEPWLNAYWTIAGPASFAVVRFASRYVLETKKSPLLLVKYR